MDPIEKVFDKVERKKFVPAGLEGSAELDMPLPIGFGQTISQPTTVKMMLEWLEVQPGDKVLDVGSGSGWTTALLAHLTGPKGRVYAVEKIPELVEFGRQNVKNAGVKNASFYKAGKIYGLIQEAPFDRILVSAAADKIPNELIEQLKTGGKMVVPVNYDVLEIEKVADGDFEVKKHPGFAFVPLVPSDGRF